MSERLEEMLRIARAATPGPWRVEDPMGPEILFIITDEDKHAYEWLHVAQLSGVPDDDDDIPAEKAKANAQHIATFNPRTAEALVKRQIALEKVAAAARVLLEARQVIADPIMPEEIVLQDALTAAMEDNSNAG